jgi:hypothetical protein
MEPGLFSELDDRGSTPCRIYSSLSPVQCIQKVPVSQPCSYPLRSGIISLEAQ